MYKPIFTLIGNKYKMIPYIIDDMKYIPTDYIQYVELFGGTLSLLNNINIINKSIIVNDFNPRHSEFYKLVKNDINYVLNEVNYWSSIYIKSKNKDKIMSIMNDELLKGNVAILPLLTRLSVYSSINRKNISFRKNYKLSVNTILNIEKSIINLHNTFKLNNTKIYNYDMTNKKHVKNILKHIKPKAFVFLDPPYIQSKSNKDYGNIYKDSYDGFTQLLIELHKNGTYFMLTNIYNKNSIKIYKNLPFKIYIKKINISTYSEIIVTNY